LTRVSTAKSQKSLRSGEEDFDHMKKKLKLLEDDREGFFKNAEQTKRKNNEYIE